ncbi:MAG: hypothetical protein KC486_11500, partial [Myxococcales bacterium]|nr:hypothetical protein [Myxococcales bacterium]
RDAHRRAVARALLASSGLVAGSRRRLEEALALGAPDPAWPIYIYAALEGWLAVREGFDREDRREAEHDYAALVRRSFRGGLSLDFTGDSIRALLRDPQAALGALQVFGGGLGYGLRARVGLHRAPPAAGERAFDVARFLANHGHAGLAVADAETAAGFAAIARVDPYLPLTRGGWTEAIETAALVFGPTSAAGGL